MSCNLSEYVWERGIRQGENALGKLINILLSKGEVENAQLVATDEEARKEFYKKYGMIEK